MAKRQIVTKPENIIKVPRPVVNFAVAADVCKELMDAAKKNPNKENEGWCNSATHSFSLYFLQEAQNYEDLCSLIRRGLKKESNVSDWLYNTALMLMKIAYRDEKMAPMDGDENGIVNVREIVDTLRAELLSSLQ